MRDLPFPRRALIGGALSLVAGCSRPEGPTLPSRLASSGDVTVLVFFSPGCGVLRAHDDRLRSMVERHSPRGARFRMVVSERERDEAERALEARGLPGPALVDTGASLADALSVRFSAHAVVIDRQGKVAYSGGIDQDMVELHEGSRRFVDEAIEAALSGRPPEVASAKTLGCVWRR